MANSNVFFENALRKNTNFIFEDELCVAFDERWNQQAPVHFIVAPKKAIPRLYKTDAEDAKILSHMLLIVNQVAASKGLAGNGFHVVVDEDHHTMTLKSLHVFGRALHHMVWPVGPGARL